MWINRDRLEKLVIENKDYIGVKISLESIISVVSCISSTFTSETIVIKIIFIVLTVLSVALLVKNICLLTRKRLGYKILIKEIDGLNLNRRRYTLVALECNSKYLLCYDEGNKCYFSPNFKTQEKDNVNYVERELSAAFGLQETISCEPAGTQHQELYSYEHNEMRSYEHQVYKAFVKDQSGISLNGKACKWMSIPEMEADKTIMERNGNVVELVKECLKGQV